MERKDWRETNSLAGSATFQTFIYSQLLWNSRIKQGEGDGGTSARNSW